MNRESKAALLVFLGGLVWSFTGLFSKLVSWSSFTLVGVRSIPALIVLGLGRGSFRIRPNKGLWISAAGITLTSLFYMTAIRLTSTANAIVLQYTASVFVILYTFLVKKQRPLRSELIAAGFVILGVCLCFGNGLSGGHLLGNLVGLLSGVSYAVVFLASRYSGNDPVDGVYFGTLVSCAFVAAAPFDPAFALTGRQLLVALALGCGLGFGYLFFSLGMRAGISAVKASVISNVEPVLNPVWVYLVLGENPGVLSIIGASVVLLAVTLQSVYEARRSKRG